jgi:hypothetical protein
MPRPLAAPASAAGGRKNSSRSDAYTSTRNEEENMSPAASGISPEAVSLQTALRRLWADHVIWTRDYVVAAVAGTPDAEAAATRLLKNQEDIGNAVALVYGETAGQALTDLLKQHIMIAVDLIEAAKSGSDASFEQNDRKWTENAERSRPCSAAPIPITGRRQTSSTY